MPSVIYLAAAAYATADGGALAAQAPAGNGNGNIESNEFLAVPIAAITDGNADGLLDQLDPTIGFSVRSVQSGNGFTFTWPSVPGKSYQVVTCDAVGGVYTNLGSQTTAASGQTTLSYSDATAATRRFYKVKAVTP